MVVSLAKVKAKAYRRRVRRRCEPCRKLTMQVETRTEADSPDWGCTSCGRVTWPDQITEYRVTPGEIRNTYWALGEANPAEYRAWLRQHSEDGERADD